MSISLCALKEKYNQHRKAKKHVVKAHGLDKEESLVQRKKLHISKENKLN